MNKVIRCKPARCDKNAPKCNENERYTGELVLHNAYTLYMDELNRNGTYIQNIKKYNFL